MTRANALLTPEGRRRLAPLVIDEGWPMRRAAERFRCSPATVKRRVDRYRQKPQRPTRHRPRQAPRNPRLPAENRRNHRRNTHTYSIPHIPKENPNTTGTITRGTNTPNMEEASGHCRSNALGHHTLTRSGIEPAGPQGHRHRRDRQAGALR